MKANSKISMMLSIILLVVIIIFGATLRYFQVPMNGFPKFIEKIADQEK
jgi:hypothetical protein